MPYQKSLIFCAGIIMSICVLGMDGEMYDARSSAMSGASVTQSDVWSGLNNEAGLGFYAHKNFGINCANRFMLPELTTQTLIASFPAGSGTFDGSLIFFGGKPYCEEHLSIAYGRKLFEWLGGGMGLFYHHVACEANCQHASAISGDIGFLIIPSEGFRIGIKVLNPTRSKFNNPGFASLPSGLITGVSYSEEESFTLATQIEWNDFTQLTLKMGAECLLVKCLSLSCGIRLPDIKSYSFGFGIHLKRMDINLGFEKHQCLGFSSSISWIFKLNKDGS